jgi:hypothetical protein
VQQAACRDAVDVGEATTGIGLKIETSDPATAVPASPSCPRRKVRNGRKWRANRKN